MADNIELDSGIPDIEQRLQTPQKRYLRQLLILLVTVSLAAFVFAISYLSPNTTETIPNEQSLEFRPTATLAPQKALSSDTLELLDNYTVIFNEDGAIKIADVFMNNVVQITSDNVFSSPELSPSQEYISFMDKDDLLWVYSLKEETITQVSTLRTLFNYVFWHPNGKMLYFSTVKKNEDEYRYIEEQDLYVYSVDSQSYKQILPIDSWSNNYAISNNNEYIGYGTPNAVHVLDKNHNQTTVHTFEQYNTESGYYYTPAIYWAKTSNTFFFYMPNVDKERLLQESVSTSLYSYNIESGNKQLISNTVESKIGNISTFKINDAGTKIIYKDISGSYFMYDSLSNNRETLSSDDEYASEFTISYPEMLPDSSVLDTPLQINENFEITAEYPGNGRKIYYLIEKTTYDKYMLFELGKGDWAKVYNASLIDNVQ